VFRDGYPLCDVDHEQNAWLLAVPVRVQGEPLGVLITINALDHSLLTEHSAFLSMLGAFAAVSIANARLAEESRHAMLAGERERIAREMHDGISQSLFSVSLGLELAKRQVVKDPLQARRTLEDIENQLSASAGELRRLVYDLRPKDLQELGLVESVRTWVREATYGDGVRGVVEVEGQAVRLSPSQEACLYRVAKEAVSNGVRHSDCRRITVLITYAPDCVTLTVSDDGKGIVLGEKGRFVSVFALIAGLVLMLVRPKSALERVRYYDQMHETPDAATAGSEYSSRVTSSMMGAVGYVAGKRGMGVFVYEQLERAGWPLRPTEYIAAHLLLVIVAGALVTWASGSLVIGVLAIVLAVIVPLVIVDGRIRARERAFESQLPDVLTLIAGALRAGWGLQQSIDLVVEQMAPPVSTEFARAQTEVRLGRTVEEALETVAQRTRSEDFSWAVTAIGIQRDVGGNLAEVLDLVAVTIRDRGALKRQIAGLTAEGRLSAWILLILPFALIALFMVINPGYLAMLYSSTLGLTMLVGGGVLLLIGALWLRSVVTIEV